MTPSRRSLLATASSAVALSLVPLAVGRSLVRAETVRDPRAVWAAPDGARHTDPRLRALSHAILAPNPHNRQPWLIELAGDDRLTLFCDLDRRLPETDPLDRQITIGLGGFLELLRMAAAEDGYEATIVPLPKGEPGSRLDARPIAEVRFSRAAARAPDPLFAHVRARRTSRAPYDMARPVEPDALRTLAAAVVGPDRVSGTVDPARVATLRAFAWKAFETEMQTPAALGESIALIRLGRAEVAAKPDGISLDSPELEHLVQKGILNHATLRETQSPLFRQFMAGFKASVDATPAFLWVVTPDNRRLTQLESGRDWLRLQLAATGLGLSMQPQSQALQEFPEMEGCFREVHALLGAGAGRVQMFTRLGYAPRTPPAPRWPMESRLRS